MISKSIPAILVVILLIEIPDIVGICTTIFFILTKRGRKSKIYFGDQSIDEINLKNNNRKYYPKDQIKIYKDKGNFYTIRLGKRVLLIDTESMDSEKFSRFETWKERYYE